MWLFVTKLANVWHIRKFCSDFMPSVVLFACRCESVVLARLDGFFLTGGVTSVHLRC